MLLLYYVCFLNIVFRSGILYDNFNKRVHIVRYFISIALGIEAPWKTPHSWYS